MPKRKSTRKPYRRYRKSYPKYRRKLSTRYRLGNPHQKVFYYKRTQALAPIQAPATSIDVTASYVFTLAQVPAYTDFTAMYDFYKINAVKVRFLPYYNSVNALATNADSSAYSSWNNLRIFSAIDYNATNTFSSTTDLRLYQNCKITQYTRGHVRYFRPMVAMDSDYQIFTRKNPWIASSSPSIQHHSLLIGVDTSFLDSTQFSSGDILLRMEVTYYLSFKSPN